MFLLTCATTFPFTLTQPPSQHIDNSNPTDESEVVYKIKAGGDVLAPRLIHSEEPRLSKTLRKSREIQTVSVKLTFYVEKDGTVSNILAVGVFDKNGAIADPDSNPTLKELKQDAVEAAELYKFKPGTKNGQPVRVELTVVVSFHRS